MNTHSYAVEQLAQFLRYVRLAEGLTQRELAVQAGLVQSTLP
jgi:transcriptional regulator with XRE-family HTH domain